MKALTSGLEVIHKEVVIIGNGPSGISLSAMLSGLEPYLVSCDHPDEMLSARLHMASMQLMSSLNSQTSFVEHQELLDELATGLEGRTTNPISLLLDALEHPCADLGIEMPALIQWRKNTNHQIDHVVLGKGPPGGSWHTMDPNILTLSLGSWMALPGLSYVADDTTDSQRRASAGSVARYYQNYVNEMNLNKYFQNDITVINVEQINTKSTPSPPLSALSTQTQTATIVNIIDDTSFVEPTNKRKCPTFVSAINFIRSRTRCQKQKKNSNNINNNNNNSNNSINNNNNNESFQICSILRNTCKRPRDNIKYDQLSPTRKVRELLDRKYLSVDFSNKISTNNNNNTSSKQKIVRSLSLCCDPTTPQQLLVDCDKETVKYLNQYHIDIIKSATTTTTINYCINSNQKNNSSNNNISNSINKQWLITAFDNSTGRELRYTCNNLVLANGASDLPNRLGLPSETNDKLSWLLHDLRRLENKLDEFVTNNNRFSNQQQLPDPVLVIGAGLSAADAVIATRFRNIPVIHVFRNRSVSLDKQLPENMYPEYHKVHQMMLDGGSTYPLYTALPEYSVTEINTVDKVVTVESKYGLKTNYKVSFVVILIGSRPNLSFMPNNCSLGIKKSMAVDAKQNPIDINHLTHSVNGYDGLYAIGPVAGDNFVRFIPGGALAVLTDLYNKRNKQK